jgi:hypothetical protein
VCWRILLTALNSQRLDFRTFNKYSWKEELDKIENHR